jgi:hypothetical protein
MDCEEERRRVVEWATIDPIASAMDVDFWMRERRLRDGGYRWQRRGGIEIEGVGARKKRNGRMPTLLPFIYTKLYGTQ